MGRFLATKAIANRQSQPVSHNDRAYTAHPYTGMWTTADGQIRHELLPNCRYLEADDSAKNIPPAHRGRDAWSVRSV
ncbi:MAG: Atu4866 domain-containing protein [Hyphomonas sp.]